VRRRPHVVLVVAREGAAMSDVPYRPPRRKGGVGLLTGSIVALVIAIAVGATLIALSTSGTVKAHLGSPVFVAGRARDLAPQVTKYGPIGLPPLVGDTRPIYLQHLGGDEKKGWVAIQALNPGEPGKCVLRWVAATMRFRDPCTGLTYPPDGTGLVRYPAVVLANDRIQIDLRTPLPAGTTVTTGTAPPS
jgi:hypothetical protein